MQRKRQIWVDADACPKAVKDMLYRAAERCQRIVVLVANTPLQVPQSRWVKSVTVPAGFDVADTYIVDRALDGDIAVTADLALAADLVERGVVVISPRGERFSTDNIRQRLQMRDIQEQVRQMGVKTSGPAPLNARDKQLFANCLDRLLAKMN